MTIKVGDTLPEATLTTMTEEGPGPVQTGDFFAGKTVVLFSVPGAFTPTCSARHLPGFIDHIDAIKAAGADEVACMSVNDVFVMDAWGKGAGADGKVVMLADGNAEFASKLGLTFDGSGFGMGTRAQRFALIAKDGVVSHLNVEEPGAFDVSSADYVLKQLNG